MRARTLSITAAGLFVLAVATLADRRPAQVGGPDLLASEIARWTAYVRGNTATDEAWTQVKQATEPVLARAGDALRDGRRLLALQRLGAARLNLSAARYVAGRAEAERQDPAAMEKEWARMGGVLKGDLGTISPRAFDGIAPAAVRALAEAALPQVRVFYDASLEYGRSTNAQNGLYYIGVARAQREFAELCRKLSTATARRAPAVRGLSAELDGFEAELLAAYRPPASIDQHGDFIGASAALKEARELDAAGLRYGALARYLAAAQRFAAMRPVPAGLDRAALERRLAEFQERIAAGSVDHSIAGLLVETAQADLAAAKADAPSPLPIAAAIATDVLPRYFAALEPPRPAPARPAPTVTVTLVRWPYT
jgi:hypothetical protein